MALNGKIKKIFKKKGPDFIKALLKYEQNRFNKHFVKGSVYEEINELFGIFPKDKQYPVYFTGQITKPKNKYIFIGINPGYGKIRNHKEQIFLEKEGLFEGDQKLFQYFKNYGNGLLPYYSNIKGFLMRLYNIKEKMDWDWCHNNLINLELIPYHSSDASGLRINEIETYRKFHFEALLKIIKYLNPKKPIFINGFPGFERYLSEEIFKNVITFKKHKNIWIGKIGYKKKYKFVGLPFLTMVKGGKNSLSKIVKKYEQK